MTQLEEIQAVLAHQLPEISTRLAKPIDERQPWFLKIKSSPVHPPVTVEWRPGLGFGVSTPEAGDYGVGPDEVYRSTNEVVRRGTQLLGTGSSTSPA